MEYTGSRSSNELKWLNLWKGQEDSNHSNGRQGDMPHLVG